MTQTQRHAIRTPASDMPTPRAARLWTIMGRLEDRACAIRCLRGLPQDPVRAAIIAVRYRVLATALRHEKEVR